MPNTIRKERSGTKPLNIRGFPNDLRDRIKASAIENRRSMTQEIIIALEYYLKEVESKK